MILNWFSLLLVLSVDFKGSRGERLTKATNFDNYLEILPITRDIVEKLRIIEAVWGEIRTEVPVELQKVHTLYQQLQLHVLDDNKYLNATYRRQQQAAHELQQEIRRHLVNRNGNLLANAFNGPNFENGTEIQLFCRNLIKNYEQSLVVDIYEGAIDEIYNFRDTNLLAAQLRSIYLHNSELSSYKVMVESQLYLYSKFQNRRNVNDLYLFNLAYYLNGIQEDNYYLQLERNVKRRLDMAIAELPTSLQFLFFRPSFCLLNKAHSEFMYTANIFVDADRQRVFTWREPPNSVADNGIWVKNLTEVSDDNRTASLNLKFSLKSLTVDHFMYLERNVSNLQNLVLSWRPGNALPGSTWSLQLVENQLVFSQDDFVMCVSSTGIHDTYRRYVNGYRDSVHSPLDQECQWIAKACSIIMDSVNT